MKFESCKSFYNMGESLNKCFDCSYCFVKGAKFTNMRYPTHPNIPVSVNLFYGDPMLQIEKTIEILKELELRKHKGIVFLCTRGDFSKFPLEKINLNLWIGFSYFNKNSRLQFEKNLIESEKRPYNYLIEFRPIIKGQNDSTENVDYIISKSKEFNYPVSFDGLKENDWKVDKRIIKQISESKIKTSRDTLKLIKEMNKNE